MVGARIDKSDRYGSSPAAKALLKSIMPNESATPAEYPMEEQTFALNPMETWFFIGAVVLTIVLLAAMYKLFTAAHK
jgi:hypothetical protein